MTLEFPLPKNVASSPLPSVVDSAAVFRHPKTSLVPYGEEREKEGESEEKESDDCDGEKESIECEEKEKESIECEKEESIDCNENTESDAVTEEETSDVIALSKDAPMAPILGPFCVICGRYGQYICDKTDEDVCSLECKQKAEARLAASQPSNAVPDELNTSLHPNELNTSLPSDELNTSLPSNELNSQPPPNELNTQLIGVANSEQHRYIANKHRFKDAVTILDSHKCPLCGRTGHLPQDCRYACGKDIDVSQYQREQGEVQHRIHCETMTRYDREEVRTGEGDDA